MRKSITTGLIALFAIVMCAASVQAQNATSGTTGPLTWTYDTGTKTLTISGKGEMPDYEASDEVPWKKYAESILTLIVEEGVTGIGNSAFRYAKNMHTATLPNSLSRIGDKAFSDCYELTHVTLPEGLKTIGSHGFSGCSFSSITLPERLKEIGEFAFSHCELTTLRIPAGLKSMGRAAFSDNYYLTEVTVDPLNTAFSSMDGVLFNKDKTILILYPIKHPVRVYVVPQGVRRIEDWAFSECVNLLSVTFQPSIESLGRYAFGGCHKLTSITFSTGLKEIGFNAFEYCDELTSITIPEGVQYIKALAFSLCKKLTSVTLPSSLRFLGSGAFKGCENLKHVVVKTKKPLDEYADVFREVPLANVTLTVPKGSKAAYAAADEWKKFKQILEGTVDNTILPEACIYAVGGRLYLILSTAAQIGIYNINSTLVRTFTAPAGETTVNLPQGAYVVRAGERTEKILVN